MHASTTGFTYHFALWIFSYLCVQLKARMIRFARVLPTLARQTKRPVRRSRKLCEFRSVNFNTQNYWSAIFDMQSSNTRNFWSLSNFYYAFIIRQCQYAILGGVFLLCDSIFVRQFTKRNSSLAILRDFRLQFSTSNFQYVVLSC